MNSLWPAASRISCLNTPTIFQSWQKVDCLAARLAQRSIRPYSISSLPFRRRDTGRLKRNSWSGLSQGSGSICRVQDGLRTFATRRIIREFEDLPQDYADEDGLAFRSQPLATSETIAIFGKGIDANAANRVLRVLHGRRVAGTLDDPEFQEHIGESAYERRRVQETALVWLRENVPVDEIQCAGLRAEKELAELEESIVSDAERIGIYKPNSGTKKNVYGKSGLDHIRKTKEREFKRLEASKKKQAEEIRQTTGTLETLGARSKVELQPRGKNPRIQYYIDRATLLTEVPEMSKFQRLWPSAIFCIGFVAVTYLLATVYTPPRPSSRMFPDMPPSAATIIGIITANSLILAAWRVPPLFRFFNKFFILVPGYPRSFSLLGGVFSHQSLSHFGWNMAVLWFVGTRLHDEIGRANFLAVYMSAGVIGNFVSLSAWVLRNNFVSSSLGASGALCGIIAAYLWLNSEQNIKLFGVFPPDSWPSLSAMSFLALIIGLDIVGMNRKNAVIKIDHWAHLGGYAAGIASAEMLKMRARQKAALRRRGGV